MDTAMDADLSEISDEVYDLQVIARQMVRVQWQSYQQCEWTGSAQLRSLPFVLPKTDLEYQD